MEPQEFWNTYVQKIQPADFVWRYGKGDIQAAVEEYLRQRPSLFGIVRRGTWRETFRAAEQFSRQFVYTGLRAFLEETEDDWRPMVDVARQEESRLRAEAKARAEAEALALAVARVEAEARARAEAERLMAMNGGTPGEAAPTAPEADYAPPPLPAEVVLMESALTEFNEPAGNAETVQGLSGEILAEGVLVDMSGVGYGDGAPEAPADEAWAAVDAAAGEPVQEGVGAEPSDAPGETAPSDAPATP